MLATLTIWMKRELGLTLQEANFAINACTKKTYLCIPATEEAAYNAKIKFITGEEIPVVVKTYFSD